MSDKWYIAGPLAIGTIEPQRTLHVEGSEIHSSGPVAGLSFQNRQSSSFVETPAAGERWVWYASGGAARLWSGNDKLVISKEGNVGIGTTTPAGRLNISESTGTPHGPNAGSLVIDHENVGGASSIIFRSKVNRTSDYGFIQFQDAAIVGGAGESCRLIIGTNNDADDHIVLMPSGNVGIGTNDPKAKLDVAGDINVTGNITASVIKSLEERVTKLEQEITCIKNGPTKVKFAESSDKAFTSDIATRLQCRPNHFIKWEETTPGNQEVFVFEIGYGSEEKWQIKESAILVPWW